MSKIAAAEDLILTEIGNTLVDGNGKSVIKANKTIPGPMSHKVLKQMAQNAPAVYTAFLGGKGESDIDRQVKARFTLYLVSRNARGAIARRRGGTQEIGIYDMMDALIPQLDGFVLTDIARMDLVDIRNMFTLQLELNLGAAIYALVFELPNFDFGNVVDENTLNDFVTYAATHSISADPDVPTSQDQITLEQ